MAQVSKVLLTPVSLYIGFGYKQVKDGSPACARFVKFSLILGPVVIYEALALQCLACFLPVQIVCV